MVSFITPPVALGAFAAASMAGAGAFRTGLKAMKLDGVIYFVPFFFVLNPALIGQGTAGEVALVVVCALIGVWFIAAALQGNVSFDGPLHTGPVNGLMRCLLFAAGLLIAAPAGGVAGLSHMVLTFSGFALALLPLATAWRAGALRPSPGGA